MKGFLSKERMSRIYLRGQQSFSEKGQKVIIAGIAGHVVSVTTT